MKLNFEICRISNEEFLTLDENFRGFFNEFNTWELADNPLRYWRDSSNNIDIYFTGELTSPQNPRPYVHIGLVKWEEKFFRFYFNFFYISELTKAYKDIRETCWTIFKIELVKGWDSNNVRNIEIVKEKIIRIAKELKEIYKMHFINNAEIKFVESHFETRPIILLGEMYADKTGG